MKRLLESHGRKRCPPCLTPSKTNKPTKRNLEAVNSDLSEQKEEVHIGEIYPIPVPEISIYARIHQKQDEDPNNLAQGVMQSTSTIPHQLPKIPDPTG